MSHRKGLISMAFFLLPLEIKSYLKFQIVLTLDRKMHLQEAGKSIIIKTFRAIEISSLLKKRIHLAEDIFYVDEEAIRLSEFDNIYLIGIGKASIEMGRVVEDLLGDKIRQGILVTNRFRGNKVKSDVIISGHPIPNDNSVKAARRIIEAIRTSSDNSLFIFVISGGGSSLVELPQSPLTLRELQKVNQVLVTCGASIYEINVVRKSLSQIKGGKLGLELGQRKCVAIYLSDVNSSDLSTIASGPLVFEVVNKLEVSQIFEKYLLTTKMPAAVLGVVEKGKTEKPQNVSHLQLHCRHLLLADNTRAIVEASEIALHLNYRLEIVNDLVEGDYRSIADTLITRLIRLVNKYPNEKVCIISGGEVNCEVNGRGVGGRNQEFVLYSASKLAEYKVEFDSAILSTGTDGIDGISIASGAVMSQHKLDEKGIKLLVENDSHSLLKHFGGLIVLGPTGNNIRDLRIHLASPVGIT